MNEESERNKLDRDRLNDARFFTQRRQSEREGPEASNREGVNFNEDGVSEDDYLSSSVASSTFDYRALTEYEK